jgi:hypothetical protein
VLCFHCTDPTLSSLFHYTRLLNSALPVPDISSQQYTSVYISPNSPASCFFFHSQYGIRLPPVHRHGARLRSHPESARGCRHGHRRPYCPRFHGLTGLLHLVGHEQAVPEAEGGKASRGREEVGEEGQLYIVGLGWLGGFRRSFLSSFSAL